MSTTEDYSAWMKADLQFEADSRGLTYSSAATKADLVALLKEDDAVSTTEEETTTEPEPEFVDPTDLEPVSFEGEEGPIVLEGTWVLLNDTVDEEYRGHPAVILQSPWQPAPIGMAGPVHGYTFDEDNPNYIVRTRDQYNATLEVDDTAWDASANERVWLNAR